MVDFLSKGRKGLASFTSEQEELRALWRHQSKVVLVQDGGFTHMTVAGVPFCHSAARTRGRGGREAKMSEG